MILFILGGIQILSFGFLASQIHILRKEVLLNRKALAHIKRLSPPRMHENGPDNPHKRA
jgi:hypothetical protein